MLSSWYNQSFLPDKAYGGHTCAKKDRNIGPATNILFTQPRIRSSKRFLSLVIAVYSVVSLLLRIRFEVVDGKPQLWLAFFFYCFHLWCGEFRTQLASVHNSRVFFFQTVNVVNDESMVKGQTPEYLLVVPALLSIKLRYSDLVVAFQTTCSVQQTPALSSQIPSPCTGRLVYQAFKNLPRASSTGALSRSLCNEPAPMAVTYRSVSETTTHSRTTSSRNGHKLDGAWIELKRAYLFANLWGLNLEDVRMMTMKQTEKNWDNVQMTCVPSCGVTVAC